MVTHRAQRTRSSEGRHRIGLVAAIGIAAVALVLTASGPVAAASTSAAQTPVRSGTGALPVVQDGGTATIETAGPASTLRDTIVPGVGNGTVRSYEIEVEVSIAEPGQSVNVSSSPWIDWSNPAQLPGGPDGLPPLSEWEWKIGSEGHNVTDAWHLSPTFDLLYTLTSWTNATYTVIGTVNATVAVTVQNGTLDGSVSPGVAFVSNSGTQTNPSSRGYAALTSVADALHPVIVRFGIVTVGTGIGWNNSTEQPVFNFTAFANDASWVHTLPASVLLTLPVGTWGDGNTLPAGMPLNLSLPVGLRTNGGYLPTPAAYAAYVGAIVNFSRSDNLTIRYWTIGNEMPLPNATVALAYIQLFNVAAATIHATFPRALVGSDVMTSHTYLPTFAALARGVGFLSFHFYPANAVCDNATAYCVPNGSAGDYTDAELWQNGTTLTHPGTMNPTQAQELWHNLTGRWLPIFDAESNLNAGGGSFSVTNGTDPRQDTTFAAAWLGATLMNAAEENVTAVTYYTLSEPGPANGTSSAPYGGWGFGMTSQNGIGNYTFYAPYWALHLWGSYLPAGAPGVLTRTSNPSVVRAYTAEVDGNLTVALASGVNTTVTVNLTVTDGHYQPAVAYDVDSSTYQEALDATPSPNTVLVRSGIGTVNDSELRSGRVTISGYGLCLVEEVPFTPTSSHTGNDSGGSSGGTTNRSGGDSTGPTGGAPPGSGATGPPTEPPHGSHGRLGIAPPGGVVVDPLNVSGGATGGPEVSMLSGIEAAALLGLFTAGAGAGLRGGRAASRPPIRTRPPVARARPPARRR